MLFKIVCPECKTEGSFSLSDRRYQGPYRCWKCRKLYTVLIEDEELKSCEPLTDEEFQKQQEIEALKRKFRNPG
jgi:transposase-like protein